MIITCFGREKFQPKEKGKSISGRKRYIAVDFIKWFLMGISNKGPRIIFHPDLFFYQTECNMYNIFDQILSLNSTQTK